MRDKCLIIGATNFSRMLRFYIETYGNTKVSAYVVDKEYANNEIIDDLPVVAFDEIRENYPPDEYAVLLGLGYRRMNELREKKFIDVKSMGYEIMSFIHPHAIVADNCTLGEGNIVLEGAVLAFGVTMGNCNIVWNGCNISHESQIGDFNYFSPGVTIGGNVRITKRCFLGMNSIVGGASCIGNQTLIGAGAFVKEDTNPFDVYVPERTRRLDNHSSLDLL